jgi:hypothetical protein
VGYGAVIGGALGSVIPGVGTVLGGVIGGIGDWIGGLFSSPPPPPLDQVAPGFFQNRMLGMTMQGQQLLMRNAQFQQAMAAKHVARTTNATMPGSGLRSVWGPQPTPTINHAMPGGTRLTRRGSRKRKRRSS